MSSEELTGFVKKNPISVGCGLLTLALIGVVYFRNGEDVIRQTSLDEKTVEAARLATNLKNSSQLKEQFEAVVAAEKEIEIRMIRASDLPTNRQYFYKFESETGVKLLDLRQVAGGKKEGKDNYLRTTFNLNVQGEYSQLLAFLRRVENGTRYCRVLNASCASAPERGQTLTLNLSLELLGFP